MEGKAHQISVVWDRSHRRASMAEKERGKIAALDALYAGKTSEEAAQAGLAEMFKGRVLIFGGVSVNIDGENFK